MSLSIRHAVPKAVAVLFAAGAVTLGTTLPAHADGGTGNLHIYQNINFNQKGGWEFDFFLGSVSCLCNYTYGDGTSVNDSMSSFWNDYGTSVYIYRNANWNDVMYNPAPAYDQVAWVGAANNDAASSFHYYGQ